MKKLIALLLAAVMLLSMTACGDEKKDNGETTGTTAATEATDAADATDTTKETEKPEETEPFVPEIGEGVYGKISYTTEDAELANHLNDVVANIGDKELTISQLQVYYWMYIYSFLNDYSYYLDYFGLDLTRPLDQQKCSGSEGTWQQYFITEALNSWHVHQALALDGATKNVTIDETLLAELESFEAELETAAKEGKYESIEQMLNKNIGPGVTVDSYKSYLLGYYTSMSCYDHEHSSMEVTQDMIDAYFTENEKTLSESGITKESGKLVDVRHILLSPKGGTTDKDGKTTYTDAEWAACEAEAQAILDQWLAGEKTEDSFAKLANEHSTDPGSSSTGGLYTGVAPGQMVEEFEAWCFDGSRQVGDYGLVKTPYGYHIMFYSGDEAQWIVECRNGILNEKINEYITNATETYPMTVDYEKILIGNLDLGADTEEAE